jgi:hypothetical protein
MSLRGIFRVAHTGKNRESSGDVDRIRGNLSIYAEIRGANSVSVTRTLPIRNVQSCFPALMEKSRKNFSSYFRKLLWFEISTSFSQVFQG